MTLTGEDMAPRSSSDNLVEIKINVPSGMLDLALTIFEELGQKPGDGHRDLWITGFHNLVESSNRSLINKKLRRRLVEGENLPDDKDT